MATISEALAIAIQRHQAGDLQAAEQVYRQILAADPSHADALHLLGVIAMQLGQHATAAEYIRRAIDLDAAEPAFHCSLGNSLQSQGKLSEAVVSFRQALALQPDNAAAHYNLANALQTLGSLDEAIDSYRRSLELNPNHADSHSNLGAAFKAQRKLDESVASYRQALDLNPADAVAHFNLGTVLTEQGQPDDAVLCFRRALELRPDHAEAHCNLGNVFKDRGRIDEAVSYYRQALALKPDLAEAHNNLGAILHAQGHLPEALHCYERALDLNPDYGEAHSNYALLLLLQGEFLRGWPEYEWRRDFRKSPGNTRPRPKWDGSPLGPNQAILLHIDGGLGDTLHFIRYAPLIKQRAGQVILRCPKKQIPLLSTCRGIDQFVLDDEKPPAFNAETTLMSLPLAFQSTVETVPREVPYLFADPALVEQWRARLPRGGFNVGIAWQGNPEYMQDSTRSVPLRHFAALAQVDSARLISLQKIHGLDQLAGVKDLFPVLDLGSQLDESGGVFMDTAAVMMSLDLVITSDTAVAHLAGALGVPVWVALSFVPEWRFLLDRTDSPWYPTMRLFRQKSPGDWTGVFDEIQTALRQLLS